MDVFAEHRHRSCTTSQRGSRREYEGSEEHGISFGSTCRAIRSNGRQARIETPRQRGTASSMQTNTKSYSAAMSAKGMRIYWVEMLERAHLAAVTAILRSRRWLAAVLSTFSEKNALAFAAVFRGPHGVRCRRGHGFDCHSTDAGGDTTPTSRSPLQVKLPPWSDPQNWKTN